MADTPAPDAPAPATPEATPSAPQAMGKLTLIGAGHVFQIGPTIRGAIQALNPDIVFVELDPGRLEALIQRSRGNKPPPAGGLVHRKLAEFQEGVAGLYGADVGSEMLAAVHGARDVGARLSLIDDPAEETLRRAKKQVTVREWLRGFGMIVGSGVKSLWPANRRRAKADIERELAKYQHDPQAMLTELGKKFPTLYRVLIAERDAKMSARIRTQLAGARHGVAILGDGHVNGMQAALADLNPTVFRLAEVREGRLPKPGPVATGTSTSIGFTVEWRGPP